VGRRQVTDVSSPSGRATRAVVERYLGALNRHDPDAIAACVANDFFNEHTSALGTSVRGRDAYRDRLGEFLARFTHLHYTVEEWIVDGEHAAVPYRMACSVVEGTTAYPVEIRGIFRFHVCDGEIVHRVDYWDSGEFTRQIRQVNEN
jgi:steroid delta-isomerase-like uncharacterized protein